MIPDSKPNFVFFGTPLFAEIILDKLIEAGYVPSAVICNPDRPVGRKKIITPPPVKQLIADRKLPIKVWQPEKLEIGNWKLEIGEVDFAIVAAYAKIIKKEILDVPKLGVIGVHPSLLPKYRGSSPIQSAILAGEEVTGVTLYFLDERLDHGPILAERELEFPISNIRYPELLRKLAELGVNLLIETIPKLLAGKIETQTQNEDKATYTSKFSTQDGFVDEKDLRVALAGENKEKVIEINRKIRALNPEPGPWSIIKGKRTKFLESEIKGEKLILKKIQVESKKPIADVGSLTSDL